MLVDVVDNGLDDGGETWRTDVGWECAKEVGEGLMCGGEDVVREAEVGMGRGVVP